MFSPGNAKLGTARRIWSFSLPSRTTCPGRSVLCAAACYSDRLERIRPAVRRRYELNFVLSRRPDFVDRVVDALARHRVAVLRIHVGGDFDSAAYARRWLAIMRRAPGVVFYFYTRSWRIPAIRRVLVAMARLSHVHPWYSCDRETGLPRLQPRRVRLAWMMTRPDDLPPRADLIFRTQALRRLVRKRIPWSGGHGQTLVCPVENGVTGHRTDCARCGICWRPQSPRASLRRTAPAPPSSPRPEPPTTPRSPR